jgi:hypothetical protein
MFFQRKRSKKTEDKLRRARTRRIIDSLNYRDNSTSAIKEALVHLLEKEL